ncbi:hypothetical protein TIFTF001_009446 [Ficus carica]|uniref:Hydroxyproline-rich glycoprotein family protein n=1 Tax=Ficus carica TaxID=3494 RepID=A0AA88AAF0_FICCA|nr:hypothetical protein TIFTF001_009446 [Ficus carica]
MEEKLASSSNCRPTISFPLGMILLVITLLLITAFFFCCTEKQSDQAKTVTVVMPGDDVPKFIGMACPCEPLVTEKITVVVHKPFS